MTQSIEVVITATGETKVQTRGFVGPGCRDASRFIEEALGQRAGEQLTSDFHQTVSQAHRAQAGH